jgi:multisubunit Na+/H+ antiporter MnhG subunit
MREKTIKEIIGTVCVVIGVMILAMVDVRMAVGSIILSAGILTKAI